MFNDPPHRGGNADAEVVSRGSDSRTRLDPRPVNSVQPEAPGNKGREVPFPADLVETLADLASFHSKGRGKPTLDISRQWAAESMKRTAAHTGIGTAGLTPTPKPQLRPPQRAYPRPSAVAGHQSLADTQRYVELAGTHHEWVAWLSP